MRRRTLLTSTAAVAGTLASGCLGGGGGGEGQDGDGQQMTTTTDGGGSDGGETTTVTMVDTAFDPMRASVDVGTTVEWVNDDGFGHDVTSAQFHDAAASWNFAKDVPGGGSITRTFDDQGVYEYYCTIHGKNQMCGVLLVGDVTLDSELPCESGGDATTEGGGGGDTTTEDGGGGYY